VLYRRYWSIVAAAAIATSCPIVAQTPDISALRAAVRTAVDRGELLYIYDQAAWHGTDDIRDHFPGMLSQAGGYVLMGDQTQTELVYFDKSKSRAVYRATFTDGKLSKSGPAEADRVGITAQERQMIEAKEKALDAFMAAKVGLCSKASPNVTALPPEKSGGPIIVYLMTPQTDLNTYPLGGHFSVEVSQDGSVSKVRRFTNSCIDMPMNQHPQGGQPAAFAITHLLDPTPTEIHVFTSIASKMPIYVMTSPQGRLWAVEGNSVRMLDMPKAN
jgi:hypothetical protein